MPDRPPHPYLKALGQRIRDEREHRNLSQEAFADAAGLDRNYMSGIERGIRNLGVLQLVKIAKALDEEPGSLLPRRPR